MPKTEYGKEVTTQKEDIFVASVQDPKHFQLVFPPSNNRWK